MVDFPAMNGGTVGEGGGEAAIVVRSMARSVLSDVAFNLVSSAGPGAFGRLAHLFNSKKWKLVKKNNGEYGVIDTTTNRIVPQKQVDDAVTVFIAPINEISHLHHAWPKYLGGPSKQVLERLSKSVHDAYHSGLDKILPRQWSKEYYDNLSDAARRQMECDLADYTQAFDAKYGTNLWQSMLDNGFPGR